MYPDDRVLVGVITRKKDLKLAHDHGWYRVPQSKMPRGVHAEYVAFFLSSRVAGKPDSGIYYYARRDGVELAYRRDLLPDEANHPRADEVYYQVQLADWREKVPPILNPTRRTVAFIYTTWDRFVHAREIKDLYSAADYYVDRIYHALRNRGLSAVERYWDAERRETGAGAHLRILCEHGAFTASTEQMVGDLFLEDGAADDAILAKIRDEITRRGGPVMISLPLD
ncbi:MAG: hypothetical protein CL610_04495 [Anaerolineaceae bacterium]|nr:hypothetical protein [Anaerolineaceae bacterium]